MLCADGLVHYSSDFVREMKGMGNSMLAVLNLIYVGLAMFWFNIWYSKYTDSAQWA
jgi:hypothetical protein